jgi:YD repeat-containing protein
MQKIKILHLTVLVFILMLCFCIPIHAATNKYDDFGQLIQVIYENGDSLTYNYDTAGNVISTTFVHGDSAPDPASSVVTFIVDGDSTISGSPLVQIVPHGGTATAPDVSRAGGWLFDDWNVPFNNVTENVNVTAQWLRIGAVSTGGRGHVNSYEITYLARHIAGHPGFEIPNRRVTNLLGEDRNPRASDITMLARWLVGYNLENLISLMLSAQTN